MKTSLAQKVLRLSLSFISLYQSIRGKRIINNPVVLCYHNVGYDTWNFTISPKSLTEQLTWVKQSARVVPVSQIQKYQKKKESVVAVSFDDGYRSMLTRADAIVKKLEIQPMLFILGNPKKANRVQLDNKLPLLKIS